MATKTSSVMLVLFASFISAIAQILFKIASEEFTFSIKGTIFNLPLVLGFAIFAVVAFIFIIALKSGELTVLYPLLSTTYVWVAVASPFFFATDSLSVLKIAGIATIIFGTYFIGRGMQHKVEVI